MTFIYEKMKIRKEKALGFSTLQILRLTGSFHPAQCTYSKNVSGGHYYFEVKTCQKVYFLLEMKGVHMLNW